MGWPQVLTDREAVAQALSLSCSLKETLGRLGLPVTQRTRDALTQACVNYGLDTSFPSRYATRRTPDAEVFCENSTFLSNFRLKIRFLEATGIPNECVFCGLGPVWNGAPLTLQLDHINGINTDHRLENLRLLCPNCHSQTPTYAGKRRDRAQAA